MKIKNQALRAISLTLSFALIQVSFGPEAWAQTVPLVTGVSAPVGGGSGASVSANTQSPANTVALQMPAASLMASPLGAPSAFAAAPAAAFAVPSLPVSAIAAAAPASGLAAAAHSAFLPHAAPVLAASVAASAHEKGDSAAKPSSQSPAAAPAAESKLESGPSTAGVGSRMARRMAELKKFFTGRRDAGTSAPASESAAAIPAPQDGAVRSNGLAAPSASADDKVSQGGGDTAPPAPAPDAPKKSKAAWLGLGAAGASIIAYALTMQIGLEAQGVAMPQLTENAFKDFTLLPLVTVFASVGSMIGQPMSRYFTEHFGLAKTFYAAHALRAISLGVMVLLFGTGVMSMPLMMGFYLLNGIVTGVASTAEGTLKKLILAEKGVSQQSFRTWWQLIAETLAVPAPIIFGGLVFSLGAIGAPLVTAVYPVTILLGLILAYILHVYPLKDVKKASDMAALQAQPEQAKSGQTTTTSRGSDWLGLWLWISNLEWLRRTAPSQAAAPVKTGVWKGIKNAVAKIFATMEEGKNFVMSTPYLKYPLAAAVTYDLFNIIIYRLISPGWGKMTGGAAGLSAVQGNMVGMFSLGGLLLSIVFITIASIAKKRAAKSPATPEAAAAAERSTLLRWTLVFIPALALMATMAVHVALPLAPLMFLGTNWMPGSIFAAALIPFGFFQVAASIVANSYYQEKLPQDAGKVQKALAFSGSVMTALSILAMLAMRPLFSAVDIFNPFPKLAWALIPIAIGLIYLWNRMRTSTKPEAVAAADAAQAQRDAGEAAAHKAGGAYVGLILGIVAAAVVITALPMIPAAAGMLAALSVLARFGVNLGLTLMIPLAGYLIGRWRGRAKDAKDAKSPAR
jgi:hypothetical protein